MRQDVIVGGPFDLDATLESGQAFRWERHTRGWVGVASGHLFLLSWKQGFLSVDSPSCENPGGWARRYFDLETDYQALCERLRCLDAAVSTAVDFAPGLRLLRQEPWEALLAFILSTNNNIPRIRRLVNRVSLRWGERLSATGHCWWALPTPSVLATATEQQLRECGVGYRAPFLIDAARKVSSGDVDLARLESLTTADARTVLQRIKGVGRKVADCVLLFGLARRDAFPIDVWIKRGLEEHYFDGQGTRIKALHEFAASQFTDDAGYAQNYLFYHTRTASMAIRKKPRGWQPR